VHIDAKILCFRVIYGKIQGIFYLTTLIITSLRPFRVWQVPQEYENIQICHESGGPRLSVQCIAFNIRVWLEFFFGSDRRHICETRVLHLRMLLGYAR